MSVFSISSYVCQYNCLFVYLYGYQCCPFTICFGYLTVCSFVWLSSMHLTLLFFNFLQQWNQEMSRQIINANYVFNFFLFFRMTITGFFCKLRRIFFFFSFWLDGMIKANQQVASKHKKTRTRIVITWLYWEQFTHLTFQNRIEKRKLLRIKT